MIYKIVRNFGFFNKQISTKYGKKCCRYNQDGKPLQPEIVSQLYGTVSEFINGWQIQQDSRRLVKHFYIEDYLMGIQFIKEVAKIDALSSRNCPSFSVEKGEVLTLNLYSPPLDGLSQKDFELAMAINRINFKEYFLIEIDSPDNYKKQVQAYRLKKQSEEIQAKLAQEFQSDQKQQEQKQQI
ncbi:Transcriptional coactivator/pterin dehydratase [Pseudocohnilembus persalinus]|uniref:4a-hydroxytetrahydrobiopterin dehydratase n=1 Tax=Pseudocohnilembus persalinus TaxID=266149 RepID=A0A0V0R0B0_PSEPJ|nr:Transcriptional coactivator/pterin dehydratase [Pseudocohnilembus persalinus]|eukprot:KRX07970.1 Transcriptional coactivator/pterin dehydratase [Pseudocohnilembus persalinus]